MNLNLHFSSQSLYSLRYLRACSYGNPAKFEHVRMTIQQNMASNMHQTEQNTSPQNRKVTGAVTLHFHTFSS